MSQHATELCLLLVDDTYGELASRVFGALSTFGRLPIETIKHHTKFTTNQVWHSLALLVQQHLIFWYIFPGESTTYYEANLINAYALVQFGKHAEFIETRLGASAASILSDLHKSGHATVQDLETSYITRKPHNGSGAYGQAGEVKDSHTNGEAETTKVRTDSVSFFSDIQKLLEAQYLIVVHESHFRSEDDNLREAERLIKTHSWADGALKGEDKIEFEETVKKVLREWKCGSPESRQMLERKVAANVTSSDSTVSKGRKRTLVAAGSNDEDRMNKKRFIDGGGSKLNANGWASIDNNDALDRDHSAENEGDVLRINYEKLSLLVRNEIFVRRIRELIGDTTALVYSRLLRMLEKDLTSLGEEGMDPDGEYDMNAGPTVATLQLLKNVQDITYLSDGIGQVDPDEVNAGNTSYSKKHNTNPGGEDEVHVGDEVSDEVMSEDGNGKVEHAVIEQEPGEYEDAVNTGQNGGKRRRESSASQGVPDLPLKTSRLESLRRHLLLLAEHPTPFLTHHRRGGSSPDSWSVPFGALTAELRRTTLFETINSRHGESAHRLARILHEKGKLDEKALATCSLMNQKVMRTALASMHSSGHLELQEVPRDNNRQPSRTLFLWFFDPQRCGLKVLDETYKAMARLVQRTQVERKAIRSVLEKASRTDVIGHEEEFLTKGELAKLGRWRAAEERMWGELGRLDEIVCLLREK